MTFKKIDVNKPLLKENLNWLLVENAEKPSNYIDL